MAYRLSVAAEDDLFSIFVSGVSEFGIFQAERYYERLEACFDFLEENPRASHLRLEISPPVRVYRMGTHAVVYLVDENNNVLILRVRHSHEDWLSI